MRANKFFFGAFVIFVLVCLFFFFFFGFTRTQAQGIAHQHREAWHGGETALALHKDWSNASAHSQEWEQHRSEGEAVTEEIHENAHLLRGNDGGEPWQATEELHLAMHHIATVELSEHA